MPWFTPRQADGSDITSPSQVRTMGLSLREPMLPFFRRYVPLAAALKLNAMGAADGDHSVSLSEMRHVSIMVRIMEQGIAWHHIT